MVLFPEPSCAVPFLSLGTSQCSSCTPFLQGWEEGKLNCISSIPALRCLTLLEPCMRNYCFTSWFKRAYGVGMSQPPNDHIAQGVKPFLLF